MTEVRFVIEDQIIHPDLTVVLNPVMIGAARNSIRKHIGKTGLLHPSDMQVTVLTDRGVVFNISSWYETSDQPKTGCFQLDYTSLHTAVGHRELTTPYNRRFELTEEQTVCVEALAMTSFLANQLIVNE